ncbi:MAG: hypothetical protein ABSD68_02935 [Candidatus Micrarchaeales archaeon]|jgi:hypothetical protein
MQALPFGVYGFNISILLVGIMLGIGGIVYGIGYAINDKRFKEFGRSEIIQSLINGALVGGFLILFVNGGIVDSLINSVVLANGTEMSCSSFLQMNSAICFAYSYLVGTGSYYFMGASHYSVLSSVMGLIVPLTSLYAVLGIVKLFVSPILSQIQSLVEVLGAAAVSATVQASILMFIAASAVAFMLPLGLMLRSFYPTRGLGSFLIALTIGLYIVFPLSYLMDATIASYYSSATTQSEISMISMNASSISKSVTDYVNKNTDQNGVLSLFTGVWNSIVNALTGLLNYLFNAVAYFIVYSFILPAFSLMVTGISVRELSKLLGSDSFFGKFNLL